MFYAFVRIAFCLCLFLPGPPFAKAGEPVPELWVGHTGNPGSIHDLTTQEFANHVNAAVQGAFFIRNAGASTLGNEAQMVEKVIRGELAFCIAAPVLSGIDPAFAALELPYLVLSRNHVRRVRDTLLKEYLRPAAETKGLKLLALWENGFRHITNNIRPVVTPADLTGIKLRVPQGSRLKGALEHYGAQAEEYPFGEVYEALKTGKFDGQENPLGVIEAAKFNEVQKYLSLTAHLYSPLYLITGSRTWNSFSPSVQETILKAAEDLQDWSMALGERKDAQLRAQLSRSMRINEVDPLSFLVVSLPVYVRFAKEVPKGKELISLLYDRTSLSAVEILNK